MINYQGTIYDKLSRYNQIIISVKYLAYIGILVCLLTKHVHVLTILIFNRSFVRSPRVAIFGDLGNVNAQALPRLQEETQSDFYDMIIHNGDFAYDMDTVAISAKL